MTDRKKSEPEPISHAEWLAALNLAEHTDHPNAKTLSELETLLGRSRHMLTPLVRDLVREGKAKQVMVTRLRTDGSRMRVPAYILQPSAARKLKS